LAYRVLLDLHSVQLDDDVQEMLKEKEVNYWMGPGAHAVCYQLRNSRYLNSKPLRPVHCWPAAKNISGPSRTR
jgi:salicylate hydroxylase